MQKFFNVILNLKFLEKMKKVLLIGTLFMFAAINVCFAQTEKVEVKSDSNAVEATPTVQPAAELEKIEADLKMAEDAIKQAQDKQTQKRDELKKQFDEGLIDEAEFKKAEEAVMQAEENLRRVQDEMRKDSERKKAELDKKTEE